MIAGPKPPCANGRPRPMPGASPARGANQRPGPDCGAAAGCCCCTGGVACFGGGGMWRWAPRLRPPPSLAASTSFAISPSPNARMNSETINFFMVSLRDSKFISPVQSDDARAQVEVFDLLESRGFQHSLQALLVGVHADRFGEITIGRFVPR